MLSRFDPLSRIHNMHLSELIAIGYFLQLLAAIGAASISMIRKRRLAVICLGVAAVVWGVSRLPPSGGASAVIRAWAPGVYLILGYWLPGALFTASNQKIEQWLWSIDRKAFGRALTRGLSAALPPVVREYLEISYLMCYPLVPVSFGVVYVLADPQTREPLADRFWSTVLLAAFTCYGLLPWAPTRPPRVVEPLTGNDGLVRRVNALVLRHGSIRVNTFPSGHVAAAVATALEVSRSAPGPASVVAVLAASIGIASVVGRYHYLADALLGAVVALAAFAIVSASV